MTLAHPNFSNCSETQGREGLEERLGQALENEPAKSRKNWRWVSFLIDSFPLCYNGLCARHRAATVMIRSFALTDLNRILEIEQQSFPKSPYSRTTFVHLYWLYPETFWIYVDQDKGKETSCGYLVFSKDGHLISLAIDPRYRRKGIGKTLLQEAMETLAVKKMWAEVRRSNQGALAFYQQIGFQVTGVIPDYYGSEDALIVRWAPAENRSD